MGGIIGSVSLPFIVLLVAGAAVGIASFLLRKATGRKQLDADYVESGERLGLVAYLYCGAQILFGATFVWFEIGLFVQVAELIPIPLVFKLIGFAYIAASACYLLPWLALIVWELFHPQFLKGLLAFGLRIVKFWGIFIVGVLLLMIF